MCYKMRTSSRATNTHIKRLAMRPDEFNEPPERGRCRGGRFELFFYEHIGTRYQLRFTRLALGLLVCLTVIPGRGDIGHR